MPRTAAGAAQDVERGELRPLPRAEQDGGLEIPLNRTLLPHHRPGVVERDPPVDAERGAAGLRHLGEQLRRRAGAEVDRRHACGLEHARRVRRHELPVVGDRKDADPGVEELDRVGARGRRRGDVAGELLREPLHQRMPGGGLAVHERLGADEVAAPSTFDEVAGNRERGAAEADERTLRLELVAHEAHGFEDRRRPLLGVHDPQPLDRGGRVDPLLHHRPDALDELDVDTHAEDRGHDVGEEHGGVDAVPAHRLQRHLGAELRRPGDVEEAVPLP